MNTSMASAYKVLRLLDDEDGMNLRRLRLRMPFRNVPHLLDFLESLGYITHRITGQKVSASSGTEIRHHEDELWYPTELGLTALDQYLENHPPVSKTPVIILSVGIGVVVLFLYLIITSGS